MTEIYFDMNEINVGNIEKYIVVTEIHLTSAKLERLQNMSTQAKYIFLMSIMN